MACMGWVAAQGVYGRHPQGYCNIMLFWILPQSDDYVEPCRSQKYIVIPPTLDLRLWVRSGHVFIQ